jgi:rubrerythrin
MGTLINEIIKFAMGEEIKAAELYEKYAKTVKSQASRRLLEDMAKMEWGHETKLRRFLETGKNSLAKIGEVPNLKISDFLVGTKLTENSSIQDVFIFAMKAEQKAYELYSRLADLEPTVDTIRIFRELAQEEKKHKNDLEHEYETVIMKDM